MAPYRVPSNGIRPMIEFCSDRGRQIIVGLTQLAVAINKIPIMSLDLARKMAAGLRPKRRR